MAAVVAKNAVGSSWRKTLGSREWSRVPGALLPPASRSTRCCDSRPLGSCRLRSGEIHPSYSAQHI